MKTLFILLSAAITRVFDFCPAPGQFTNVLPAYESGDDAAAMCLKAEDCLKDHHQEIISLGGWGGYIVVGFDHEILNLPGEYDLKILGNAFYSSASGDGRMKGSSEPGVVMVSRDVNQNGLPDDPWYELVGSEYKNPLTRRFYQLTYHRPSESHVATPDAENRYLTDTTYIAWRDADGKTGYLYRNSAHTQDYYPMWMPDQMSFSGTLLPPNTIDESGVGANYLSYCYDWGYADNMPNEDKSHPAIHASEFMLDWAIDSLGNPVQLPGIHFLKIQTGTLQNNGWLGESSTELMDAYDLHPDLQVGTMAVATFENRPLGITIAGSDSLFVGTAPLLSGVNSWHSGSYRFYTYNDDLYGASYYYAFVVSRDTLSVSSGYMEPYRSASGGAFQGEQFAVWSLDFYGDNSLTFPSSILPGMMVNNNAYTVSAMRDGGYSRPFNETDTLSLLCIGRRNGQVVDTVFVDLASEGMYISSWTWVDLSALGEIDELELAMEGSDSGAYGLNTPAYVCIDNLGCTCPAGYQQPSRSSLFTTAIPSVGTVMPEVRKLLINGQLYIVRGERAYTISGNELLP